MILEVRKLNVYYGNLHVLKDVSLKVEKNRIITIIGSNGAGKSTLLRGICGLLPVRRGEVIFNDIDITNRRTDRLVGLGVSLVPEGREVFTDLTVEDNLLLGATCHLRKVVKGEIESRFDSIYRVFPRLKERALQMGGTLSGGEQQRVAIARSLVNQPSILLADEPTGNLDSKTSIEIMAIFQRLNSDLGITIVMITHEPDIASYAGRNILIKDGSIVEDRKNPSVSLASEGRRV